LVVTAYGIGGGNEIYRNSYPGNEIGNTIVVPVQVTSIESLAIFVNGNPVSNYSYEAEGLYETRVVFNTIWTNTDQVSIWVFGSSNGQNYSWSTPVTQSLIYDGSGLSFSLNNSLSGTNPANIIVEKNGIRARPAEGIEYVGNGSTTVYELPYRGGYNQGLIANNEVSVYINTRPLTLGVDFVVDAYDISSNRTLTLTSAPAAGSLVLISVNHAADYYISSGNTLIWRASSPLLPLIGDVLTFTTFNDTRQQDLLTQVFVGPETTGISVGQGYDTTDFDDGTVPGGPGTFDYGIGTVTQVNRFDTGRLILNSSRLSVTLNGRYLFEGDGFIADGSVIEIPGAPINTTDVVAITSLTQSVIPGEIAFRVFQDMRGTQSTYRITSSSTTVLVQELLPTDDVIYVQDASRLSEPNLAEGIFGQITINGERITYRNRDTTANTVSGLRRGTVGTAADEHSAGSAVYDIGIGNYLPMEYQDRIVGENFLANGITTVFTAAEISLSGIPLIEAKDAVVVYVGGLQPAETFNGDGEETTFTLSTALTKYTVLINGEISYINYNIVGEELTFDSAPAQGDQVEVYAYIINSVSPVEVEFDSAPPTGFQVSLQVRQGLSWYNPGPGTASDGVPLQETNTLAAGFIRGV
jgi:hypothetical protein